MNNYSEIVIAGKVHRRNRDVDRFQIDVRELGDLKMNQIPPRTHVEIMGLTQPRGFHEIEVYGLHAGDAFDLSVYGGISFKIAADEHERIVARLRRAFPSSIPKDGGHEIPWISSRTQEDGNLIVQAFMNFNFSDRPNTLLKDAVDPYEQSFLKLARASVHAFICHSSEDKPFARDLAKQMKRLGAEVWFDEWEIRVGDSIVQKVNDALGKVSHLIVLLSSTSVEKPWVKKELSSALMRQLSEHSVSVLPILVNHCDIPPILYDVKYSDGRRGIDSVMRELEIALFNSTPNEH